MTTNSDRYHACASFIPIDRRIALLHTQDLDGESEGCALFADLSGYTNLTAELTHQLGAEAGVELLASTLNRIYDTLIAAVHRFRGCVLTFAGDAITCWFSGDDGTRAISCAQLMRTNLQPFSRLVTPSGSSVSLQIKISIASGKGKRLVIGDPKINVFDVILGDVIDEMALGEKCAERGNIVLSEALAHRHQDHISVKSWVTKDEKRFAIIRQINYRIPPSNWPPLGGGQAETDKLANWLLPAIYQRILDGQKGFISEVRPVASLFLRFTGINCHSNVDLNTDLNRYIQAIQKTINRYGGDLLQVIFGDKGSFLYASFGCPISHERDEHRAVAAAIACRTLRGAFPYIETQQIGLSYGSVYTGPYGSHRRQTYGIVGPEANIAARLMSEAADDQILIPQDMANRLNQKIWARYLGFTYIKGIRRSIKMFDVMDKIPNATSQTMIKFAVSPLGREKEANWLVQQLKDAEASQGKIISIIGESGTGKTHLVMSLSLDAAAQPFQVVIVPCDDTLIRPRFYSIRELLRSFTGLPTSKETLERSFPEEIEVIYNELLSINPQWKHQRPLLDLIFFPPDEMGEDEFAQISIWMGEILRTWTQITPLLLVIDDTHWVDAYSLKIFEQLRPTIEVLPILAIGCMLQDQEILNRFTPDPSKRIRLGQLPIDAVRYLAESHLGSKVAVSLLQLIYRQSAGNPAFVHQLISQLRGENKIFLNEKKIWQLENGMYQHLIEGGIFTRKGDRWMLNRQKSIPKKLFPRPNSITTALLARYDRLSIQSRLILKLGAAMGQSFGIDEIKKTFPTYPGFLNLKAHVTDLLEDGILKLVHEKTGKVRLAFSHPVMRDVLFDALIISQ